MRAEAIAEFLCEKDLVRHLVVSDLCNPLMCNESGSETVRLALDEQCH